MRLGNGNHLMYCANFHLGGSLERVLAAISQYATAVKGGISPLRPLALGLRLSGFAARELLPATSTFRVFLNTQGFYVVSINGFSYGGLHEARIKEGAYLPDWTSARRVAYTLNLARILCDLLPEDEFGTISTVPCHYGKTERPGVMSNLLLVAGELARIETQTGRRIVLALEPEPDCLLDSRASTISFFENLFSHRSPARRYIGVCLDCCHAAVAFESPLEWLRAFRNCGIAVPKIQVSASLRVKVSRGQSDLLRPFLDDKYLHQTRVARRGRIQKFADLSEAVSRAPQGEWRIHFHVPLGWDGAPITSTSDMMEKDFFREALSTGNRHLEVDTCSFAGLPGDKPPPVESVISELQWLKRRLSQPGCGGICE